MRTPSRRSGLEGLITLPFHAQPSAKTGPLVPEAAGCVEKSDGPSTLRMKKL